MTQDLCAGARAALPESVLEQERARHLRQRRRPQVRQLIWQATQACNFRCRHCAAGKDQSEQLDTRAICAIFADVAQSLDPARVHVGITGGEPFVRRDLASVIAHLVRLGFVHVGVASNGFLAGRHPTRLAEVVKAGLRSLNVSLDGDEVNHNALRRHPQAYHHAVACLEAARSYPQLSTSITMVVTPASYGDVPQVVSLAEKLGTWIVKLVPAMPYGSCADAPDLWLDDERFVELLERVASHRRAFAKRRTRVQVTLTDDGFLGCFEGHVRNRLFNCPAGVSVATIWHDGRLAACPQLSQTFNFQGDLTTRRFGELWAEGFTAFRQRQWLRRGPCRECDDWRYCQGGSLHDRTEDGTLLRCNALTVRSVLSCRRRDVPRGAPPKEKRSG